MNCSEANLEIPKGTISKKLTYSKNCSNDIDYRKSVTEFVFTMSRRAVTWNSRKQPTVALSTTEAAYMAISSAVQECLWLNGLKEELLPYAPKTILYTDNQSALQLTKNSSFHTRTKHIDVKRHFVREVFDSGHIGTTNMTADILTNALPKPKISIHSISMGLI